jgi:hypothetical protein
MEVVVVLVVVRDVPCLKFFDSLVLGGANTVHSQGSLQDAELDPNSRTLEHLCYMIAC